MKQWTSEEEETDGDEEETPDPAAGGKNPDEVE